MCWSRPVSVSTTAENWKDITFSLHSEVSALEQVIEEKGSGMGDLVRHAHSNYIEKREWIRAKPYEKMNAREEEG